MIIDMTLAKDGDINVSLKNIIIANIIFYEQKNIVLMLIIFDSI